jgi:hypothetical protein
LLHWKIPLLPLLLLLQLITRFDFFAPCTDLATICIIVSNVLSLYRLLADDWQALALHVTDLKQLIFTWKKDYDHSSRFYLVPTAHLLLFFWV